MKISKISNCGIARFTLYVEDIIYNLILNASIFLQAGGNVIIFYPRDAQERVPYKNINIKKGGISAALFEKIIYCITELPCIS